jgi:flotillin
VFEKLKEGEIADAKSKLNVKITGFDNIVQIAKIEADKRAEMRDSELQKEVEIRRAAVLEEKQRAEKMSEAIVGAEVTKALADANLYKAKADADGELYKKQKNAEAVKILYDAQANGIREIHASFQGDNSTLMQYIMLEKGVYVDLAKSNAEAIKGLEPKITVWNTGNGAGTDSGKAIRDIFQALPPLLSTINEQTGISPPQWLAQMPSKKETSK